MSEYLPDVNSALIQNWVRYIRCELPPNRSFGESGEFTSEHLLHFFDYPHYSKYCHKQIKKYSSEKPFDGRKLNGKPITLKTKGLIMDISLSMKTLFAQHTLKDYAPNIPEMRGTYSVSSGFDFLSCVLELKKMGVSEKVIRSYFFLFSVDGSFFMVEDGLLMRNELLYHAAFLVVLPELTKTIQSVQKSNNNVSRKMFVRLLRELSGRRNTTEEWVREYDMLSSFSRALPYIKKEHLVGATTLSGFNEIFSLPEIKEIESILEERENTLGTPLAQGYKLAKRMNKLPEYREVINNISRSSNHLENFRAAPYFLPLTIERSKYQVAILPHNDSISLLGPMVKGVCIEPSGEQRLSQLNKSFLNLCVSNDNGLLLWGLLCRMTSANGDIIYVLNNLQGSIVGKAILVKEVAADIRRILIKLSSEKEVRDVYYINQGFNACALAGEKDTPIEIAYLLERQLKPEKKIEVDFTLPTPSSPGSTFYSVFKSI